MKLNPRYTVAFIILLAIEICIALFVRDSFIRPFIGDVLVVILLYCLIMIFWPKETPSLPIAIFGFAALVEIGQYFGIVEMLHLQDNPLARVVLGTVFDIKDIICYGIGMLLLLAWQQRSRLRRLYQNT